MLDNYIRHSFTANTSRGDSIRHDVYHRGDAARTVVIIQELPGIGPQTVSIANRFHEHGYRVVLPHLFGPLGRVSMLGNTLRVFCMRREFSLFESNRTSPIVDWLRALCADLKENHGASSIGVIGMCLTGNFAISLLADPHVLAGVASQPSLPIRNASGLHMSAEDVIEVRDALDEKGPMMALRFEQDRLCSSARFDAIRDAFNDDAERVRLIELPGPGHSVLTLDLISGGEPAEAAVQSVLSYFDEAL